MNSNSFQLFDIEDQRKRNKKINCVWNLTKYRFQYNYIFKLVYAICRSLNHYTYI